MPWWFSKSTEWYSWYYLHVFYFDFSNVRGQCKPQDIVAKADGIQCLVQKLFSGMYTYGHRGLKCLSIVNVSNILQGKPHHDGSIKRCRQNNTKSGKQIK